MRRFLKSICSSAFASLFLFAATQAWAACPAGPGASTLDAYGNGYACLGTSFNAQVFTSQVAMGGAPASPNAAYALDVTGTARLSTGTAWTSSDRRLKNDIQPYGTDALATINSLKPVTYLWNNPKNDLMRKRQIGFIAQDVEKIMPDLVDTPKDPKEMRSIQYEGFIPVLTKAVQQLTQQINASTHHETAMQDSLTRIQERLTALETENKQLHAELQVYKGTGMRIGSAQ